MIEDRLAITEAGATVKANYNGFVSRFSSTDRRDYEQREREESDCCFACICLLIDFQWLDLVKLCVLGRLRE